MSRFILFYFILLLVISILIIFQWIIYKRFKKRWANLSYFRPLSIGYWTICFASHLFLIASFFIRKKILIFYEGIIKDIYFFVLSWQYSFFFSFFVWLALLTIFRVLFYIYQFIERGKIQNLKKTNQETTIISRKTFLMTSMGTLIDTTPFFGATLNYIGMKKSNNDFQVLERVISIENLHKNFQGFRIVQISDIHIGALIYEDYLKPTLEIIKNLKPDVIFVTGDILDNSNQYLNTVGWYFRKLNDIAQVYAILGNHDHIDKAERLIHILKLSGSKVLVNDFSIIQRDKAKLNIIGLDYPMVSLQNRQEISERNFDAVYNNLPYKDHPIIILNHHPSDFYFLQRKKIDLVLSGHTHGGQILLVEDRNSPLALGSHFAKYYIDLYEEKGVKLYVNRGLGHWFPLRVNCPPEITLIVLNSIF